MNATIILDIICCLPLSALMVYDFGSNKSHLSPINSHKTTFSSKTLGLNEKGINEITLENIKDNELISIHAQKDYDELIEHNFTQTILNNKESTIKGHYNETITKTHTQDIALAKIIKVGAEYNTNVALS
ncbi:bacteriophage T4 gp5 trimerisation domain-containing protein, partial [Helicobacter sp. T3_23-1059]